METGWAPGKPLLHPTALCTFFWIVDSLGCKGRKESSICHATEMFSTCRVKWETPGTPSMNFPPFLPPEAKLSAPPSLPLLPDPLLPPAPFASTMGSPSSSTPACWREVIQNVESTLKILDRRRSFFSPPLRSTSQVGQVEAARPRRPSRTWR